MAYSLLAGGKRVRPLLLILTGQSLGALTADLYPFAAALEMIHTYSLIHDDLPAMDNDDYRRGRLTNHKVYGEAGAILAGDGLLNRAFEVVAEAIRHQASEGDGTRVLAYAHAGAYLAKAAGPSGMVAGQSADLAAEETTATLEELRYIERHKTGCLLTAPLVMAGYLAGADAASLDHLEKAGQAMGTAFQIWDDVLDVEGSFEELGKALHQDEAGHKATFVSCFGLEKAKLEAKRLTQEALSQLTFLPNEEGSAVRQLVESLIIRKK
jgi:geranylgeranyl diphosphate synthase type II